MKRLWPDRKALCGVFRPGPLTQRHYRGLCMYDIDVFGFILAVRVNMVGVFAVGHFYVFHFPGETGLARVIPHREIPGFPVRRHVPKSVHLRFAVQSDHLEGVVGKIFRFTEECRHLFILGGYAGTLLIRGVRCNPHLSDHYLFIRIQSGRCTWGFFGRIGVCGEYKKCQQQAEYMLHCKSLVQMVCIKQRVTGLSRYKV